MSKLRTDKQIRLHEKALRTLIKCQGATHDCTTCPHMISERSKNQSLGEYYLIYRCGIKCVRQTVDVVAYCGTTEKLWRDTITALSKFN